jgi:hypothetical protein
MLAMAKMRVFLFFLSVAIVIVIATFIGYYARGYRFDFDNFKFSPNGILLVKSSPEGAQIYINGEFETATDATIRISPGTYDVSVRKEGYIPWEKRLIIEKEVVTEADAELFRVAPSLSAVTISGADSPTPSEDLSKIAYIVPFDNANNGTKAGLWVMETVDLPLGFSRDPRRVTDGDLTNASWEWSPDGREILLSTQNGVFLLDSGSFTPQNQRVNVASRKQIILADWEKEAKEKLEAKVRTLPEPLGELLTRRSSSVIFSPDENKILYTASSSATLDTELIKPVPGASTQKEERSIKPNHTYVYDIKEDRNFLIDSEGQTLTIDNELGENKNRRLSWFPTSNHLVYAEKDRVIIMDIDGTNRQEIYTGSYVSPSAFPTLNADRILILTNLGANSSLPNLYSLSIK